jgi:ubiquinone/menaquinone biosynthesis C-methylase UbiE
VGIVTPEEIVQKRFLDEFPSREFRRLMSPKTRRQTDVVAPDGPNNVGRVLDIGAGTGRSSIKVLKARPQAISVALGLFGESFKQHFG